MRWRASRGTPAVAFETGIIQWKWMEDVMPEMDQWNSVHDRLVAGIKVPAVHSIASRPLATAGRPR